MSDENGTETVTKVNKAESVRKLCDEIGWDPPAAEIIGLLSQRGVVVTANHVNNEKSRRRKANGQGATQQKRGRPKAAPKANEKIWNISSEGSGISRVDLVPPPQDPLVAGGHAVAYLQAVGGFKNARKWLDEVEFAART